MAAAVTACKRLWRKLTQDDTQSRLANCRNTTAQRLAYLLSPFESYLVSIQSILIWERPCVSAVVLIFCNWMFFWVTIVLKFKLYGILTALVLITYLYRTIVLEIWPEIKLPPAEGEDTEEWTPINPQVLSVPEISQYMDDILTTFRGWNDWIWKLRETNPGLFCVGGCMVFSVLAFIGQLVPGIIIVYTLLLTIITGPGVILYVIPRAKLKVMLSFLISHRSETSSSCGSEGGMDEFIPEINNEHLAALELPMTSVDSEKQESSFDDSKMLGSEFGQSSEDGNITPSLTSGLDSFPDPTYDSSDDEFLPSDRQLPSIQAVDSDQMQFFPSHFNGNGSSADGEPSNNVSYRNVPNSSQEPYENKNRDILQQLNTSIASAVISNIFTSTLSSLTQPSGQNTLEKQSERRHKRAESDTSEDSSGFVIVDDLNDFAPDNA